VGASRLKEGALGAWLRHEDGLLELVKSEPRTAVYRHNANAQSRFECGYIELGSASLHFINHCDGENCWESQIKNLREYKEARLEVGSVCQADNHIGPFRVRIRGQGLHYDSFVI
jgi:hypothetical protein